MTFIIILGVIGVGLYWLGFLDRPTFKVVESILSPSASPAGESSGPKKEVYAIVTTAQDEDYIDNNLCTVLRATKNGIEAAIASSAEKADEGEVNGKDNETKGGVSIATSYLASGRRNVDEKAVAMKGTGKAGELSGSDLGEDHDNIGLAIFLQDRGVCHESALGFLVQASSLGHVQDIAQNVRLNIDTSSMANSNCSNADLHGKESSQERTMVDKDAFFQVHAVALGHGPVFRGRIPIRSPIACYVARYMHWGRANSEYTDFMGTPGAAEEKALRAVACEIYVNGRNNDAIGSVYVDYLYLLDSRARETVWKQLGTPLP